MKKLITKYWGLVLVVILLSSLFVAGAPVSAGNYGLGNTFALPNYFIGTTVIVPAAMNTFGFLAAAQSGNTIYATAQNGTVDFLYKSTDAGVTWTRVTGANNAITGILTGTWSKIAVAPDDPNVVAVVATAPGTDVVYVSTSGGAVWSALGTLTTNAYINTIAISPSNGFWRYVAIGGNTADAAQPALVLP